jgi:hypothetical protein
VTSFNFGDLYKDATTLVTGTFDGIVSESTLTESSNGKPMIKVKLQVEGGKHHGKTFFTQFVISVDSPTALRMFFGNMKAFGLGKEYFETNPASEQVAAAIHGKRCRFTVGTREWQGVDRESVDKVEPPLPGMNGLPGLPGASTPAAPVPGVPSTPVVSGPPAGAQGPAANGADVPPPPAF